jgi:hypothetical protein
MPNRLMLGSLCLFFFVPRIAMPGPARKVAFTQSAQSVEAYDYVEILA